MWNIFFTLLSLIKEKKFRLNDEKSHKKADILIFKFWGRNKFILFYDENWMS